MTRTALSPRLSMHHVEPFVEIHPHDARVAGVGHGDLAQLHARGARAIVRVHVSRTVRAGELFAPMHWNDVHTGQGRIGALVAPDVDPISGQPALKSSDVNIAPFVPAWHGFVLSREPLEFAGCVYRASARGYDYWRHEIAGDEVPPSWPHWARSLASGDEWLELADQGTGRYRAACLDHGRLQACLFVSATPALPGREWLGSLFRTDALDVNTRHSLLLGRAPARGADPGPVVCACFSVGRNTLLRAIREQSLVSSRDIGAALSAGTNCGSCVPELNSLLAVANARAQFK